MPQELDFRQLQIDPGFFSNLAQLGLYPIIRVANRAGAERQCIALLAASAFFQEARAPGANERRRNHAPAPAFSLCIAKRSRQAMALHRRGFSLGSTGIKGISHALRQVRRPGIAQQATLRFWREKSRNVTSGCVRMYLRGSKTRFRCAGRRISGTCPHHSLLMRAQMKPVSVHGFLTLDSPEVGLMFQASKFFIARIVLHSCIVLRNGGHLVF